MLSQNNIGRYIFELYSIFHALVARGITITVKLYSVNF